MEKEQPGNTTPLADVNAGNQKVEELAKPIRPPDNLPELTTVMFHNIAAYLRGELQGISKPYTTKELDISKPTIRTQ